MANEHYARKAVVVLAAYIRDNIATYLRAEETELSLTASSLTDPVAVVEARVPNDNRSPLYEVFVIAGGPEDNGDERQRIHSYDLSVFWSWFGDADIAAGEAFTMNQYTALHRCLEADYSLDTTTAHAEPGRAEFEADHGDSSSTRHAFELRVKVRTHDP